MGLTTSKVSPEEKAGYTIHCNPAGLEWGTSEICCGALVIPHSLLGGYHA